ncbi:MAG: aldo/keto reductase [Clostridiales bacterium]|jgi:predicted aldo/keto reductase-like oxidoreductase|nr:aldo/keto reductase [Clostridiales bacterium]
MRVTLGGTGITSHKNGFGALPLQRVGLDAAVSLMRGAFEGGITYFDTARSYTDSEEKMGIALEGVRDRVTIATKTPSLTPEGFWADIAASLRLLRTDYIDVYQFHNPPFMPAPGDGSGLYEAMLEAKAKGLIRHIGITSHRIDLAFDIVNSGLYATLQFPFSYLAGEREEVLVKLAAEKRVGFVAMKALSGGLIRRADAAFAFLARHENVLPIWGIQRQSELAEFLSFMENPPRLTPELSGVVDRDRTELRGEFCRGCGYCLPCPAGIAINNCARTSLLLRRAPAAAWLSPEWQSEMAKIHDCVGCGHCSAHCPYGLDTPALLRANLRDYEDVLAGKKFAEPGKLLK